jgi:hypothetical protein
VAKVPKEADAEPAVKLGGKPFRQIVAAHVAKTFAGSGLDVYEEVHLGSSIIGKDRKVDILIVSEKTGRAVALEAKFQSTKGTADEKMHYALSDCEAMWIPAVVVYGGVGWSTGVRHALDAHRHAVRVEVGDAGDMTDTAELDSFIAQQFGLWSFVLKGKTPVATT